MGPGLDRPLRYAEPPSCLRHRGSTVIALEQYLPVLDRELHQRGSDDRGVGGAVGRVGDLQLRRIGGDDLTPATRRTQSSMTMRRATVNSHARAEPCDWS